MTTIATQRAGYNWRAFGAWLLASFVGMAVCLFGAITLMWGVAGALEPAAGETVAFAAGGAVFGLGLGLGAGLLPGLVLRQRLVGLNRWLAGSLLAGAVGGALVFPFALNQTQAPGDPGWMTIALLGAALGLGQCLALRGRVARAGWWVPASAVAVAAGLFTALQLGGEGREAQAIGGFALVYALITASVMGWLMAEGG
jgi:hypothetical protein